MYALLLVEVARFLRRVLPRPGFMPAQSSRRMRRVSNYDRTRIVLDDGVVKLDDARCRCGNHQGRRGRRAGGCVRRHLVAA